MNHAHRLYKTNFHGIIRALAISPKGVVYINHHATSLEPLRSADAFFLSCSPACVFSAPVNPSWSGLVATYAALAVGEPGNCRISHKGESGKEGASSFGCRNGDHGSPDFQQPGNAHRHHSSSDIRYPPHRHRSCHLRRQPHGVAGAICQPSAHRPAPVRLYQLLSHPSPARRGAHCQRQVRRIRRVLRHPALFLLSYIGYLLVPAIGPALHSAISRQGTCRFPQFIKTIQDALNTLEKNKTDAFPSGHTAVSLVCLYYAWKEREKMLFAVLIPVVTGLLISTVYLRYHYVIDVVAGIALTGVTIALAPGLRRLLSAATNRPGHEESSSRPPS